MNSSYALEHNCALLEQSKTLETLFRLTCGHGDADAALFLENGEEKRWSYRQYEAMTRQYAACLRRAFRRRVISPSPWTRARSGSPCSGA